MGVLAMGEYLECDSLRMSTRLRDPTNSDRPEAEAHYMLMPRPQDATGVATGSRNTSDFLYSGWRTIRRISPYLQVIFDLPRSHDGSSLLASEMSMRSLSFCLVPHASFEADFSTETSSSNSLSLSICRSVGRIKGR